jgi:xanthine dehydrogenase YagS FAD-binding subunit
MKPFSYASPTTVDDALALLRSSASDGRRTSDAAPTQALAGGTDLLPLIKADVAAPEQLVNVKRLDGLSGEIREGADGLTLGALVRLAEIETNPLLRERYTVLSEAAAEAATPQLRNMATIGGNLLQRPRCWYYRNHLFHCWLKGGNECQARDGENQYHSLFGHDVTPCVAVHPSDPPNALLALDATVRLRGPEGERMLPLADFYALPEADRRTETVIRPDELITSIHVLALPTGTRSTYLKAMDRKVWAFALAGVAAVLRMEGGTIRHARLILGGVANIPWRATAAEAILLGESPSEALFAHAADAALAGADPLAHNGYKIPLVKALVRRALQTLAA